MLTELHFNDKGHIIAAQVLASALDKSRLVRLSHDEHSYHVFYQLLAEPFRTKGMLGAWRMPLTRGPFQR
jgi:myosin heavy subunit